MVGFFVLMCAVMFSLGTYFGWTINNATRLCCGCDSCKEEAED
jgi:hypothetical protein